MLGTIGEIETVGGIEIIEGIETVGEIEIIEGIEIETVGATEMVEIGAETEVMSEMAEIIVVEATVIEGVTGAATIVGMMIAMIEGGEAEIDMRTEGMLGIIEGERTISEAIRELRSTYLYSVLTVTETEKEVEGGTDLETEGEAVEAVVGAGAIVAVLTAGGREEVQAAAEVEAVAGVLVGAGVGVRVGVGADQLRVGRKIKRRKAMI